jgi:hypothetical protein
MLRVESASDVLLLLLNIEYFLVFLWSFTVLFLYFRQKPFKLSLKALFYISVVIMSLTRCIIYTFVYSSHNDLKTTLPSAYDSLLYLFTFSTISTHWYHKVRAEKYIKLEHSAASMRDLMKNRTKILYIAANLAGLGLFGLVCALYYIGAIEYYNYQGELWYITIYKLLCIGFVAVCICTNGYKLIRWMYKYSPVKPKKLLMYIYLIVVGIIYQTAKQLLNIYIISTFNSTGNGETLASAFLILSNNLVRILPILSFARSIRLWKKIEDSFLSSFAYIENRISMNFTRL